MIKYNVYKEERIIKNFFLKISYTMLLMIAFPLTVFLVLIDKEHK
jgi:hypothetical protein